jgi:predicted kinase
MKLTIPELAVVALVGPSGSGKSTFARKHFRATEVLSSDFCRGLVSDDENSQAATNDAFEVLHFIAAKRLAAGKLVVIDATNVQPEARKPIVALARQFHCIPAAIVFDLPEKLCQERNRDRPDRDFGPHVIRQQSRQLRNALRLLEREGFRHVHILRSPEEIDAAEIVREPLWNNLKHEHGPFDIIGDVHGCFDELLDLLKQLGYSVEAQANGDASPKYSVKPPEGRKAVFLGDLVDRGPKIPDVLRLAMNMVEAGTALCVPGNHDIKLMRKLRGKDVQITHGLADSLQQLDMESPEFRRQAMEFMDDLVSHYVLDVGEGIGICYTRTGRRFFDDPKIEKAFLQEVHGAVGAAGFWEQFKSDWICLDAELMPWSAKAQELLRQQYAAVGAAAQASLSETVAVLDGLASKNGDALPLVERYRQRLEAANRYVDSYRRYCWQVESVNDLKLAPFHLLATEGQVHVQRDHLWHMQKLAELCRAGDGLLLATPYKQVDVTNTESVEQATRWWEDLTSRGGEGIVLKPLECWGRFKRAAVLPV